MERELKLFKSLVGVGDVPFPNEDEQIVVHSFEYEANRMGNIPQITCSVKHRLCLKDEWKSAYAVFNGEKFYVRSTPSAKKDNDDERYEYRIVMDSERFVLLRTFFFDVVSSNDDTSITNSTRIQFIGDIRQFAKRMSDSMQRSELKYSVVVDENVASEDKLVDFKDKFFMDALQEAYKIYEIPYYFEGDKIHFGFYQNVISTTFKYGANDGLLSISRENANAKITNRIAARGSEDNIPYYYPNNSPKGRVSAIADINNKGVKQENIILYSPELFAEKVAPSQPAIYFETLPSRKRQQYKFAGDEVFKDYSQSTETIDFNLSTSEHKNIIFKHQYHVFVKSDLKMKVHLSNGSHILDLTRFLKKAYAQYQDGFKNDLYIIDGDTISFLKCKEGDLDVYFEIEIPYMGTNIYSISFSTNEVKTSFWRLGEKEFQIKDLGIDLHDYSQCKDGDVIKQRIEKYIIPSSHLMPPIYRESDGRERFYNAENGKFKNENGELYVFDNEFSKENPLEDIVEFDEIKPSIVGMTNKEGLRIDMFSEFAYDENDSDELEVNSSEYKHPYFYAKLRKTDGVGTFNLFDASNEKQTMVISMKSGVCGACEFEIGVGEKTHKNIVQVNEDGTLKRYIIGEHRGDVVWNDVAPQEEQNDTIHNEVWIALKKDNKTYTHYDPMPNNRASLKPSTNDSFVILGITLPEGYVIAAEERLKDSMIKYMYLNNIEKFNTSIDFSRIYLAEHKDIVKTLNENSQISVSFDGTKYPLYVNSFKYKIDNNEELPEISVGLVRSLSPSTNSFDTAISSVKKDLLSSVFKERKNMSLPKETPIDESTTRVNKKAFTRAALLKSDLSTENALYDAGVDIRDKQINITTKNFKIRNNEGKMVSVFKIDPSSNQVMLDTDNILADGIKAENAEIEGKFEIQTLKYESNKKDDLGRLDCSFVTIDESGDTYLLPEIKEGQIQPLKVFGIKTQEPVSSPTSFKPENGNVFIVVTDEEGNNIQNPPSIDITHGIWEAYGIGGSTNTIWNFHFVNNL